MIENFRARADLADGFRIERVSVDDKARVERVDIGWYEDLEGACLEAKVLCPDDIEDRELSRALYPYRPSPRVRLALDVSRWHDGSDLVAVIDYPSGVERALLQILSGKSLAEAAKLQGTAMSSLRRRIRYQPRMRALYDAEMAQRRRLAEARRERQKAVEENRESAYKTLGKAAYELRYWRGWSWSRIAKAIGSRSGPATSANAKHYARTNGIAWPVTTPEQRRGSME